MGRRVLVPKYATKHNPKCRQACRSAKSTPGDPGKLAMMDRVRSSRPTSGGVEVARRGGRSSLSSLKAAAHAQSWT